MMLSAKIELWRYRLDRPVGGSGVTSVDVIVADVDNGDGRTGVGFSYVLGGSGEVVCRAARQLAQRFVVGQPMAHPLAFWRRMVASLNRIGRGESQLAIAALDVALWDLHAKQLDLPLGVAMGGNARPVPVYGSGGFNATQSPDEAAETAQALTARGLTAVKPRVAGRRSDAALIAAVADALPPHADLMLDANEKCDEVQAASLLSVAAEAGVLFVEEPVRAQAVEIYRRLARTSQVPLATGEHLQSSEEVLPFIRDGLCAVIQPDLAMVGGLSGSLRIAQLAEHFDVAVAPHFLPGLFVHLAAAAPNVIWLEEFLLLEPLIAGLPELDAQGQMIMHDRPGHGLSWADGARDAFRVDA